MNIELNLIYIATIILISGYSGCQFAQGEGMRDWAIERVTGAEVGQ